MAQVADNVETDWTGTLGRLTEAVAPRWTEQPGASAAR
jgi:hypothetical protein